MMTELTLRLMAARLLLTAVGSAPDDPAEALKLFKSFFYITHMQQVRVNVMPGGCTARIAA
jgi:hypothetical protein